jgi:hypothetical protein
VTLPPSALAGHGRAARLTWLHRLLLLSLLALALLLAPPAAQAAGRVAAADGEPYRCDGDPLIAEVHQGAVDAPGIPNSEGGTVPGAFIVLRWRGLQLQLPRTNNAGAPSYTDGRWWWQALDPDHPEFAERRGAVTRFACERGAG